jgi:GNAT superfamily N-acetyltransferase
MSRLLSALRRHGPVPTARIAAVRLRAFVHRKRTLLFYRAPIASVLRLPPRLDDGWTFTLDNLSWDEARAFGDAPSDVLSLLGSYLSVEIPGQRLLLAKINGEVAGWCIVFVGAYDWPLTETDTTLQLGETDAVFISAQTLPRFRGRHINRALMGETSRVAESLGATTLVAWHEDWNEAPRRNMLHVGMRFVGTHERTWVCGVRLPARIAMVSDA